MDRSFTIILILLTLMIGTFPARAQNPFVSKGSPAKVSSSPALPHPFLAKITVWQQQLNQKMAALTRQAKETRSLRPLLSLIAIAFAYGVLHAAGPGHGKAVAMSYIISRGRKLGNSILFGNLIAFSHGMSGAVLVLILHYILQQGVLGTMENVTRTTQLISYSLIALLGTVMLVGSLYSWYRQTGAEKPNRIDYSEKKQRGPLVMALAVGIVPCPGVVLVMLFSLSLKMVGLGFLLAFFLTLGMAMTISIVVVVALAGKNLALGSLKRWNRLAGITEHIVKVAAALMVMALGLLFLVATI